MATYIILWRFSPEAYRNLEDAKRIIDEVSERLRNECPGVVWKDSYTTFGRFDIVNIVEADDPRQVEKATMIILAYGHAQTETLPATPWNEFLELLKS